MNYIFDYELPDKSNPFRPKKKKLELRVPLQKKSDIKCPRSNTKVLHSRSGCWYFEKKRNNKIGI